MKGTLITFANIKARQKACIYGGHIEIMFDRILIRATCEEISWWSNQSPREIFFIDIWGWDTTKRLWVRKGAPSGTLSFPYEAVEHFTGPFETEDGELFFMNNLPQYITLFPRGYPLPSEPRNADNSSACDAYLHHL
jgi:hypothetical protein